MDALRELDRQLEQQPGLAAEHAELSTAVRARVRRRRLESADLFAEPVTRPWGQAA